MTPDDQRREAARLEYERLSRDSADRLRYQIDFAQSVFRGLMLINGGAIIALFTFVGNFGGGVLRAPHLDPDRLWLAFAFFVAGLVFAILGASGAFFSQYFYANSSTIEGWNRAAEMLGAEGNDDRHLGQYRTGLIALAVSVASVALALTCFVIGSGFALAGVSLAQ